MRITDPRTGEEASIYDSRTYGRELFAATQHCKHEISEARRFTNKNGAIAVVAQCLRCGARAGNSLKVSDRDSFSLADPTLEVEFLAELKVARDAVAIKHIDQFAAQEDDFWAKYDAYLQTPEWRMRRAKVMSRCGGACEGCLEKSATEVHHLTYDHVFDEFLFELVGMCANCHSRIHINRNSESESPEEFGDVDEYQ